MNGAERLSVLISLFFLFLLGFTNSWAAVYYFSATGDDSHSRVQACSPATPWRSLDRLNHIFSSLTAGDSVLFKRGDIFYGSLVVSKSGAVFAPIYLGSYGEGNKPVISGFSTLRTWRLVKPGIYESTASIKGKNVTINGGQRAMGRYPNSGYLSYESHQENRSITDLQLTSAVNWAGGEVVIRKNRWTIDRSLIEKQANKTFFYQAGNKAMPTKKYGYFIQNHLQTLDQVGEWYSDPTAKKLYMYFGNENPQSYRVMASTASNLVDISRFNHLVFENISFTGAGNNAFYIVGANNISLKGVEIENSGSEAILGSYSPYLKVENCVIRDAWSGGINIDVGCTNALLSDNRISRVGLAAGMGKSGTGTYESITAFGNFTKIERNQIDSIGYNGIYFGGNFSSVKNNYISYFCLTKDDGAAIYIGDWSKTSNKTVHGNVIAHGIGNGAGTGNSGTLQAEGIYIDDNSESVMVTNNTIFSCANNGIKIHNAKEVIVFANTVFNNGVQLRLEQDCYLPSSSLLRNNSVRGNIFFSNGISQSNASYSSHVDDIRSFGKIDSNYYNLSAVKSLAVQAAVNLNGKSVIMKHNILSWTASTGNDKSSSEISTTSILFEYNAGNKAKTVILSKDYMDVYKNIYKDKVVVAAYSSVVLFPLESKVESLVPVSILVATL